MTLMVQATLFQKLLTGAAGATPGTAAGMQRSVGPETGPAPAGSPHVTGEWSPPRVCMRPALLRQSSIRSAQLHS